MTITDLAPPSPAPETVAPEKKLDRLNTVSATRVREPEDEFDWASLGTGQIVPDELLSIDPEKYGLTASQRAQLAREETAALLETGVRFESMLMAGFCIQLAEQRRIDISRGTYMLHEVGEESRHSRAFLRLYEQIDPQADNPLVQGVPGLGRRLVQRLLVHRPALLLVFVLAGEEIPDLIQKRAADHPDTDPLIVQLNRYHRQEEARHLAYAKLRLPELRDETSRFDRFRIRHSVPVGISQLFMGLIHPGVYAAVGLPGWRTWLRASRSRRRLQLRYEACRPILHAVMDAGFVRPGRVPRAWRRLCGVDKDGQPNR